LVENRPPAAVQERILANRRLAREYDLGPSPLRVVITLREDYLSRLETWKKSMPSLMRNRMALQLLSGPQAAEAVTCPGRLGGREFVSDEVGARIVRFVAKRPPDTPLAEIEAVPPLLSLVCDELNEARLIAGASTITAEQVDLQSADILQNFYVRSFDGLHPAVQRMVEDRMVTVGGHRNSIAHEDATAELVAGGVSDPARALDQLIKGRLLSSEERGGLQRLEITHDVLTPLIVRSRRERKAREEAELAKQKAQQARQDAEALVARAKREAEEQRASLRRSRRVNLIFAVLVVITVGLGAWALQNKWKAEESAKAAEAAFISLKAESKAKEEARTEQAKAEAQARVAAMAKEEAQRNLAKAEAEAKGHFTVTVEPADAEVIVRELRGPSPFRTGPEKPGKHEVKVRRQGYKEWSGEVEVRANEMAHKKVTLELIKPFPELDQPLENTLGMKFVPVRGTKVLFGIWHVRVQDFEAFVAATNYDAAPGMHSVRRGVFDDHGDTWKKPGFEQGPTHPVCGVSWIDAMAFCEWLTRKEQAEGLLAPNQKYRLPTDAEWSVAVGLEEAPGETPASKHDKIADVYPWGRQWPPPPGAGNYAGTEARDADWPTDREVIKEYNDGYPRTSPVGSFAANKFGLYDMGGNVWQWCDDHFTGKVGKRVMRGASFYFDGTQFLRSSHRGQNSPVLRYLHFGFRCVVGVASPREIH
jgi:formylglycine-generating enzyme required for sulfatase activity